MATVREILKARLDRAQERKARAMAEVAAAQADIDALQAERASLQPEDEDRLGRLQQLGVIKAED